MNTHEYISSGILELYAAGLLSESESMDVEEIIRKTLEVKSEYEKIQKTLYLSSVPKLKTPGASVKTSLFEKIKSDSSNAMPLSQKDFTPPKQSNNYRYLMAASIAFLLLSLIANFFLWTKLNDAKTELAVLSDKNKIMVQEFEAVNRKLITASKDMDIMKDRHYKMVDLKGLEKSPSSNVVAFWNPESRKVYVEVKNLPVPPADKQYQLWAISNGKPVDGGMMDVDPSDKSLHEMKSMDDAQAFAVTLEPKGGSVNPTMDQMYVMGAL
ncbi:MAG: anti-sigma factor [bacterium]